MYNSFKKVKDFHKAFNHPIEEKPKIISKVQAKHRATWMREEIQEFLDANTIVDQADAIIDLMYFALGTMVEMGVNPEPIFNIVQNANMSKLWSDGQVRYRSDGKIMKPYGWEPPESKLNDEILKQSK